MAAQRERLNIMPYSGDPIDPTTGAAEAILTAAAEHMQELRRQHEAGEKDGVVTVKDTMQLMERLSSVTEEWLYRLGQELGIAPPPPEKMH